MSINRHSTNLALTPVLILAFACLTSFLSAQGNALIVPGEGVGVLRLGEPIAYIKQDLENTDPSTSRLIEESGQKKVALSYKDFGLTFIFDFKTKKLEKIIVLTQNLLVENTGIHVGSRAAEVISHFKSPVKGSESELDYPHLGIKFILDNDRRTISAIEVKVPQKDVDYNQESSS